MNYATVVDGFAKKCAGITGSKTWNDVMGYGYNTLVETGPVAATITQGTQGDGSSQTIITGEMLPHMIGEVRNTMGIWRLTDDTNVGMSVPGVLEGATYATNVIRFNITFRRL